MKQNKLRILCAYDQKPDWSGKSPEEALLGHEVVITHSYKEARDLILSNEHTPSFDVVLADVNLPGGFEDEDPTTPFPAILLCPYLSQSLVRGFGIFVPVMYETHFDLSDGFTVIVVTKECWTRSHKRNWKKLLGLVIKTSGDADKFIVRER